MLSKLALLIGLSLVACVDTPEVTFDGPQHDATFSTQENVDEVNAAFAELTETMGECPIVPDSEPCAAVCDEDGEGLTPFIPPGTCVTFVCTGIDGARVLVGGCRLADPDTREVELAQSRRPDEAVELTDAQR